MPTCHHAGCDAQAPHTCSKCRAVHYCCAEHQRAAWPTHKAECKRIVNAAQRVNAAGGPPNVSGENGAGMSAQAGNLLAQKAQFIASELGLDPNLPLAELLQAAARKTGMAMPKVTGKQVMEAEGLMAAAQPQPPGPKSARKGKARQGAATEQASEAADAAHKCRSCGQLSRQLCAANGCCSRCVYEIAHFERLGHGALSKSDESALERAGGPTAHTYGEMTPLGFRQLAARLGLSSTDVFVDCGSGTGRLVLQAAKEYGVRRAIGVELSSSRHDVARDLLAAASASIVTAREKSGAKPTRDAARLLCADCAAPRLWTAADTSGGGSRARGKRSSDDAALVGATVVFTCSIVFDESLMGRLVRAHRRHHTAAATVPHPIRPAPYTSPR